MKSSNSFHPYAATTILFWSLAYVLTRLVLQYFSVYSLSFLRYLTASGAMLVIVLIGKNKMPQRADLKWFLAAGFLGFFLYMLAFNKGCATVTAATSSVIIATVPVITAVLARIFYQEKLTPFKTVAIAIEFSGVIILTLMSQAFSMNKGILWLILASFCLGGYNLLQRRLTKTYSALQASAYSIFAGTIMLSIFAPTSFQNLKGAPPLLLLYLIILGVFCSALAYATWALAFQKAEQTSSVSNYMFITPFLTTLLGFVMVGEKPDLPTLVGGFVILMGVVIFNFGERLYLQLFNRATQNIS